MNLIECLHLCKVKAFFAWPFLCGTVSELSACMMHVPKTGKVGEI